VSLLPQLSVEAKPMSQVTLYLADCIAATAHDFDKKSAPKGERVRHRKLCETAADLIRGKMTVPRANSFHKEFDAEEVACRLDEMAALLRHHEDDDV
jgi:hypothetical protein